MYQAELEPLKTRIVAGDTEGALREEIRILRRLLDELLDPEMGQLEMSTGGHWVAEALETLDMITGR